MIGFLNWSGKKGGPKSKKKQGLKNGGTNKKGGEFQYTFNSD